MPEIPDLEAIRGFLEPRLAANPVTRTEARYPWLIRSEEKIESLEGHAFNFDPEALGGVAPRLVLTSFLGRPCREVHPASDRF